MPSNNYLTIDVEDYYQVSAFETVIDVPSWSGYLPRVERNTQIILDILGKRHVSATFFIVGWIADQFPQLVRKISDQGHEIGCHSYYHRKIYDLTPDAFREDTYRAKSILESISGKPVRGYRAPSYSITQKSLWALDILSELGFFYDSSIFPIYHDHYGIPNAPRFPYFLKDQNMKEFPISTTRWLGRNLPVSGGGYFRLFPYAFTRFSLKWINQMEKQPFMFYLHPWEVDPEQPRIKNASMRSRFRHYVNLKTTQAKFEKLLDDFQFGPITAVPAQISDKDK